MTAEPPLRTSRQWIAATAVIAVALAVRLPRLTQSLWADEMESLLRYVSAPWSVVLAAGPGRYVPNDHVGYTALAKLCLLIGNGGRLDPVGRVAVLVRLPSLLAGVLLPLAVAWPLRRTAPLLALTLALLTAVHPWLVAQSTEARGYALMTLLGVLATNRLPRDGRRWPIAYGLLIAAALYAVPVAGLLVVGHGVVVLARRQAIGSWMRGLVIATVATAAGYAPLAAGIADYVRHPLPGPSDAVDFVNQLPRFALAGQYVPRTDDPARHVPDPSAGIGYWLAAVAILGVGTVIGRRSAIGSTVLPMAAATVVAVAAATVAPSAGQVRFVPWAAVWMCGAMTAVLATIRWHIVKIAATAGVVVALAWAAVQLPPDQPVREAIALAERSAPPGTPVVVAFLTADESARFYGSPRTVVANGPADLAAVESRPGPRPWLVVSFEFLVHDAAPPAWRHLADRYRLVRRLPGRVSPVAVYAPR